MSNPDISDLLAPKVANTLEKVLGPKPRFGESVREHLAHLSGRIDPVELSLRLGRPLLPAQTPAVLYGLQTKRVLIADDMGIGKTTEAIAIAVGHGAYPLVVTCPGSLTLNWVKEINAVAPWLTVRVLAGRKPTTPEPADVYVLSDAVLAHWLNTLLTEVKPQALVMDECHRFKQPKAGRTICAGRLSVEIRKNDGPVIGLSGTPVENRAAELIEQLRLLGVLNEMMHSADDKKAEMKFKMKFCNPVHNGYGWEFKGTSNAEELNKRLREMCFVQRSKKDVWEDMPDKSRYVVWTEMTRKQKAEYTQAVEDFLGWVGEHKGEEAARRAVRALGITKLGTLKRLLGQYKLEATIEHVQRIVDQGDQVIVFAVQREITKAIADAFNAPVIMGGTSVKKVEEAKELFQSGEARVIVGNIKAMGVGHTLTAATHVVFAEVNWTPGEHVQGEDRAWRYGQKNAVTVWYLTVDGTIDVDQWEMIRDKADACNMVITGKADDGVPEEEVAWALVQRLLERRRAA